MKPKTEYDNTPMKELIMEKIHNPTERKILYDRFCHDMSYADLMAKYHVSKSKVQRTIRKGKERLFLE